MDAPQVIEKAISLVGHITLCDRCLGRQFAWLSTDTTNKDRGHTLKLTISMIADEQYKRGDKQSAIEILRNLAEKGLHSPAIALCRRYDIAINPSIACELCTSDGSSIYDRIPLIIERALEEANEFEFETFLVGSSLPARLEEMNEEIKARYDLVNAETIRSDFNRELGKELSIALGKDVNFERPDVVFFYDLERDRINIQSNPIFVYGRYCKLKRGVPQSRWDCQKCKGKGCDECQGTGRNYQDSISEYIANPILEAAEGTRFKFHAAGREDVDVLMLGDGRPFVVEISQPHKRNLNLVKLTKKINARSKKRVRVHSLAMTDRKKLQSLKVMASDSIKEYTAIIRTSEDVDAKTLKNAEVLLKGAKLRQRTPNRVSHRRSDLIREKIVFDVKLKKKADSLVEGYFKVQGGTYVKELISGDDGRTTPSLTEVLGTKCVCVELNVMAVHA